MRLSSMIFVLLLSPLALAAQTSSAVFAPPQVSGSCPVRLTVQRFADYGRIDTDAPTLSDQDRRVLGIKEQQIAALQKQIQALEQQKAALEAKLPQQAPDSDAATQLGAQIKALDKQTQHLRTEIFLNRNLEQAIVALNHSELSPGQGLDLTFANPPARIVAADITVHFYPASARVVPAAPSASHDVPTAQTFHLTAGADKPLLHSSVWTGRQGIVNWVELTRVDYADGTIWQPAAPRQCGAAPSLYVPVDSAR
jgi:hypothetical protein